MIAPTIDRSIELSIFQSHTHTPPVLYTVKVPARYVRAEDLDIHELAATNRMRQEELERNKHLLKQLQEQKNLLDVEFQACKERRRAVVLQESNVGVANKLPRRDGTHKNPTDDAAATKVPGLHPLLVAHGSSTVEQSFDGHSGDIQAGSSAIHLTRPSSTPFRHLLGGKPTHTHKDIVDRDAEKDDFS